MRALWLLLVALPSLAAAQEGGEWNLRELRDRLAVADPRAFDEVGRRGRNAAILEPYVRAHADKHWRARWALARMGARSEEALSLLAIHIDDPAAREGLARAGKVAVPFVVARLKTHREEALSVLARLGPDANRALLKLTGGGDKAAEKILLAQIPSSPGKLLRSPERDDRTAILTHIGDGPPPGLAEPTRRLAEIGHPAVAQLIASIPSPRAIYALALMGRRASLAEGPLYQLVKNRKPGSSAAIWALGFIGPRSRQTTWQLRLELYEDHKRIITLDNVLAAHSLMRLDRWANTAVDSLYEIARAEIQPPLRLLALRSLHLAKPEHVSGYVLDGLRELIRDKDEEVAAAAAFAYLRFRDRGGSYFWQLSDIYRRTKSTRVRRQIVEDVGRLGFFHANVRKFLLKVAQEDDPVLRRGAALALGRNGREDKEAFRTLLTLSKDAGDVRETALRGLAAHRLTPTPEDYRGFPVAAGLLRHRPPRNVFEAELALVRDDAQDPGEEFLPQLRLGLKAPAPHTRARAAAILARLGRLEGIDALYFDPDVGVRIAAWNALGE